MSWGCSGREVGEEGVGVLEQEVGDVREQRPAAQQLRERPVRGGSGP